MHDACQHNQIVPGTIVYCMYDTNVVVGTGWHALWHGIFPFNIKHLEYTRHERTRFSVFRSCFVRINARHLCHYSIRCTAVHRAWMCLLLGQKYDIIVVLLHCCMVHANLVDNCWHANFPNDFKHLRFNLRKMPVDNS